jgi:hypothetical protein
VDLDVPELPVADHRRIRGLSKRYDDAQDVEDLSQSIELLQEILALSVPVEVEEGLLRKTGEGSVRTRQPARTCGVQGTGRRRVTGRPDTVVDRARTVGAGTGSEA